MENKTLDSLLIEANHNVTRIGFDEALKIINLPNTFIIDVREESEVANLGLIKLNLFFGKFKKGPPEAVIIIFSTLFISDPLSNDHIE